MKLILYHVDAFTDKLFGGNPAAVVPLETWLDVELMQQLAMENNLSETVFIVPSMSEESDYEIRWFTPAVEINLCGHATLAAGYVLFQLLDFNSSSIRFSSKSGILIVTHENGLISMDFPAWKPVMLSEYHSQLINAIGEVDVVGVHQHRDILIELATENDVLNCNPDFGLLNRIGEKVIVTSKGNDVDFVSRFFAPSAGIDEDPVTGSAHSQLIPFWAEKLGKNVLHAKQLSKRGGELWCELIGDRVTMAGHCVFYMKGEFEF